MKTPDTTYQPLREQAKHLTIVATASESSLRAALPKIDKDVILQNLKNRIFLKPTAEK